MRLLTSVTLLSSVNLLAVADTPIPEHADSRVIKALTFQPNWLEELSPAWHSRLETTRVVPAPDAAQFPHALEVHFPKGAVGPGEGGAQFPLLFRKWQGMNDHYEDLTLSYCLKFNEDFDFVMGGKLPGLIGGEDSWTRSGGNQPDGSNGWTLRYMWRTGGQAVIYAYLPPSPNGRYGSATWGQDIALNRTFIPEQWHCLKQRVVINDIGEENGQLQVWFDGEQVLSLNNITYRTQDNNAGKIGGMYFSTFHGGNTRDWAPSKDSSLLINGFAFSQ
ncbi:hypothetical protein QWI17_23085 [Gilvimarinus sp. SDUM040013]|uniref:Polysaccharide lyase 14 domain-containing protein n=1 Tax=Gilvimarinus gilvus TaxID=3058038 RepID=A0ABU4S2Y6_9GAMM|nr:hypothetical protein [Gilvimarinus sp. SDUM040013]MDO3388750.1 hypothetical protein [Gilvimarinus sp. SDUM040013]MDX6851375.1 hypothetical protein [Gilvimarinus sp. SDUM040013]